MPNTDTHPHPKTGVASRPFRGTYIRNKLSMTREEWQTLDKLGEYLFPHLIKRAQRPSRGMILAELLKRVRSAPMHV